jgi:hypothetical protein
MQSCAHKHGYLYTVGVFIRQRGICYSSRYLVALEAY